jgi:hypothetical protein
LSITPLPLPKFDGEMWKKLRRRACGANAPEQRREIIMLLIEQVRLSDEHIYMDTVFPRAQPAFGGGEGINRFDQIQTIRPRGDHH